MNTDPSIRDGDGPGARDPRAWTRPAGLLASLLLHVLAAALVLGPGDRMRTEPVRDVAVEVVFAAPAPREPEPPPPPEPPTPEPPVPPRLEPMPAPPPPQLAPAAPAEVSRPLPGPPPRRPNPSRAAPPAPLPSAGGIAAPAAPQAEAAPGTGGRSRPEARAPAGASEEATQDEKDFLLAQIVPFWLIDYRNPRFRHIVFGGGFVLRADGMLEPPFGRNDPWEPRRMVNNYEALLTGAHETERVAIESFLRAVRAAQPFRLPPGVDRSQYPRRIPLSFRLGDL